jgi:hypothetical protein
MRKQRRQKYVGPLRDALAWQRIRAGIRRLIEKFYVELGARLDAYANRPQWYSEIFSPDTCALSAKLL